MIDSDQLAKDLMMTDDALKQQLIAMLGPETYRGEELNRSFIAERIFSDRQARLNVESAVHPAVFRAIEKEFAHAKPGEIVAVESALIFQTFLWRVFDYIVIVDATDEAILARSRTAGKFSEDTVISRLAEQDYRQDFVTGADFAIANDSTADALSSRAMMIATILKALAKQDLPAIPLRTKQEEDEESEGDEPNEQGSNTNTTIH